MDALSVSKLHKTYKGGVVALKGIDFSVKKGGFFALLGPNGAGKTSAIGIICSLVNKTSGSISVFGKDLDADRDTAKTYIGLVPQEFNFNIFEKVIDIVVQQAGYYGVPRKEAMKRAEFFLKKLDLWHKRDQKSFTLSGGMKRKLMIVRALLHRPKLLILDEPTAGVDVETRREMWAFMRELNKAGTTIILTTHYLEEAEHLCKDVAIIDKGRIIENTAMKTLLSKLFVETFVLDVKRLKKELKPLKGYAIREIDKTTLEIDVSKKQTINEVMRHMDKQGVSVVSLRNKANRLEELFVHLVKKD